MITAKRELDLLRFLQSISARLEEISDEEGKLRHALREGQKFFEAEEGCVAVLGHEPARAEVRFNVPKESAWDEDILTTFAQGENPEVGDNVIGTSIPRRRRPWAAMVLRRRKKRAFAPGQGRALAQLTSAVAGSLARMDRQRVQDVHDRLDRKIMEKLRPRDLFYQILHGLRTLTRYDHSSALLIGDTEGTCLELVAEQLACIKGKSRSVGRKLELSDEVREHLNDSEIYGFDRRTGNWVEWNDRPVAAIAKLLDYNVSGSGPAALPPEGAMICAPIATRSGVIGILKIAMLNTGSLGAWEVDVVQRFKSQASVAIQYLQGTDALRKKMLVAERKQAMANIARGVSHDINNALGSVLPMVQQLQDEAADGTMDPQTLLEDLRQIERSLKVSRRIFQGMLALARGSAPSVGEGNVRRALENAIDILEGSMQRRGIGLHVSVANDLPSVRLRQGDLAQVFLNLVSNARDAMPQGGDLTVQAGHLTEQTGHLTGQAGHKQERVEVEIRDTGCGIPQHHAPRIEEPFFTTKEDGNGLGLTICRSILSEAQGDMQIRSEPGEGTAIRLVLPVSHNAVKEVLI